MDQRRLEKVLEKDEGRKYEAYDCNGVMHIGIGHNILGRDLSETTLEFLNVEDEDELLEVTLTGAQVDYLLLKMLILR